MKIVSKIIGVLTLLCSICFLFISVYMKMIPTKYIVLLSLFCLLFCAFTLYPLFKKKSKNIVSFICILFCLLYMMGLIFIGKTVYKGYHVLDNINDRKVETDVYDVIVLKNSPYQKIEELQNKKVSLYEKDPQKACALKELKTYISFSEKPYKDVKKMALDLLENKTEIVLMKESYKALLEEEMPLFKEKNRVLFQITCKTETKKTKATMDPLKEPFNLFISGIDSSGDIMKKAQGDVNMIVTLSPASHEILLTVIPRDYYVPLHGIGEKDKLTHAAYYGIGMSVQTVEDLLDTNIPYYVRVNFDTLISIVDQIGGIDIYSDKAFRAFTNGKVYIKKGMNHLNGVEALAFARERMAYASGDRHRGENQQAVLKAILEKVSRSSQLLTNYNTFLKTIGNSFHTNLEIDVMTGYINKQLDTMPRWKIQTYNLDGSDSHNMTYSLGLIKYVMEPNYETVNQAKAYISGMLNHKTFAELGL